MSRWNKHSALILSDGKGHIVRVVHAGMSEVWALNLWRAVCACGYKSDKMVRRHAEELAYAHWHARVGDVG